MPAPHYAISEAAIVIVALWCIWRFVQSGYWMAAAGSALFGIAAAIGAYRFGTGQVELLALPHRTFSQLGGAIAISLITAQILTMFRFAQRGVIRTMIGAIIAGSAAIVVASPQLATFLFLLWLAIAIAAALLMPTINGLMRLSNAAIVGVFGINLLLIRQSSILGPDLSWHLFHLLVAAWLLGLLYLFDRQWRSPSL